MNAASLVKAYGLDALLTPQDDPALWEAALRAYWPHPADPACMVAALRFDVGRPLAAGEAPQGELNETHAKMRGMVDLEEWCFERVDEDHLRVKTCPVQPAPSPATLPGLGLSSMMMPPGGVFTAGQAAPAAPPPAQSFFIYLGLTRPSQGAGQAVVYAASSMPGVGEGTALLWLRAADGSWHATDQRVAWWIT